MNYISTHACGKRHINKILLNTSLNVTVRYRLVTFLDLKSYLKVKSKNMNLKKKNYLRILLLKIKQLFFYQEFYENLFGPTFPFIE
jgi:hypothetical protein